MGAIGIDQAVGDWTLATDEIQTISDKIEKIIFVFRFTVEPQEGLPICSVVG